MALTAPTASGDAAGVTSRSPAGRADRWRASLILTVTRRCNLRCAYCPTVKDGVPDLSVDDARRAVDLFVSRHGGGDIKMFGGEPMLRPDVIEAVMRHVADTPDVSLYVSTNGTRFTDAIVDLFRANPGVTLTLSIDGAERDHDGLRRPLPGEDTSFAHITRWLPTLLTLPRFVVTQTIAPSTAKRAAANFRFLRSLGIRRFNLLPGYYLPWSDAQLSALSAGFSEIAAEFESAWRQGERLYLRNLFTRAPTPFFNTGFVVDSDRRIHASNLVLAEAVGDRTVVGTLDDPPSAEVLAEAAARVPALLAEVYPANVLASTAAVDQRLTALCERLYPSYFRMRGLLRSALLPPQGGEGGRRPDEGGEDGLLGSALLPPHGEDGLLGSALLPASGGEKVPEGRMRGTREAPR